MAARADWIDKREANAAAANGNRNMSQMHFARQGIITEEMEYIAKREKLEPELIRSEVARGRCIIPANIHHRNLQPMAIGIATKCKINANIGNSSTSSNIDEELKKLHHAVHYGSDTVMDLSTGGDIPTIRRAIIDASPVPVGTVPIYEAISRIKRSEDICKIFKKHDVSFSLGDGLRPGSLADASDAAQFSELEVLGELTKKAWEHDVQVMIEGPGHVPMDQIELQVKKENELCF